MIEMGINVANDVRTKYAHLIVIGKKTFETRNTNSLKPYIGKRVGIVETNKGLKAKLVGFVTIGDPIVVGQLGFESTRHAHFVCAGSRFDIEQGKVKWLYPMLDPQKLKQPIDASQTKGIIARNIKGLIK